MVEAKVLIKNKVGLHARPASLFVQTANKFKSAITAIHGERKANAKSILSVLTLGADQGAELILQAEGEDAEEAVQALVSLIESNFGEAE
ncbi:HPr family phosphocarrier protein [Thermanaerothrix sp.]|jgi:phosphocarrier protein|uniref:HPr family phosphocarrier protein n=1 Tax=Thermanaerothrix sp. TaxID=2972675 RepID=UPI002ADD546D|nr:HPr family phosphocarrier protein [Thermanaerothrix sp.]